MAEQLESVIDSIGGLSLDRGTTEITGSASKCPNPTQQALVETIRTLIQSCEATSTQGHQVEALVESTHTPSAHSIVKLGSLRRRANALARIAETLNDATERNIIAYISSLAGPGSQAQNMLSHFTNELREIARDALNGTSDDSNVLRATLEMCYGQSLHTSGTLHSDNYFIPLGEASLEWPYDPDFESEDYYEHENRLSVDESYAEAFRVQCERKSEEERQQKEEWISFWVKALSECPNGPTLFYSPAGRLPYYHLADVPRYLFRAFDRKSSGKSDHNIVASSASTESNSARSWPSKDNLLSRTAEEITQMLYSHLTKPCFGGRNADNLMSWSSSLLFVIQYAIWRCYQRRCDPVEVKICMIDTRKFPRGQFARDKLLLRAFHEASELSEEMRRFFTFRLENTFYDNGEYLSQGILYHAGRSNVVSLAQLIQMGLHDLYPEFADPATNAMGSWTNRVGFLRSRWSIEHATTQLDIQRAVEIARACFQNFDTTDVALLLLSFKNRKLRAPVTNGSSHEVQGHQRDSNDYGPDEVQRYMAIAETMMSKDQDSSTAFPSRWFTSDRQHLEGVFVCL